MFKGIELTEYHIKWMQDNYGKLSRKECADHFHVSTRTIDRWADRLELTYQIRSKPKPNKEPSKKPSKVVEETPAVDAPKGYCMDCEHYIVGGQCGKNGKPTGALNEKLCFKQNTL